MVVCHQAFVVLRKLAQDYDLKYRFSSDYEWCIRCLQRSRRNVYVPEVIIDYLSEGSHHGQSQGFAHGAIQDNELLLRLLPHADEALRFPAPIPEAA